MSDFAYASLVEIRKRLLDLTANNILLHYRHPQDRCISIVADAADRIYAALQDGEKLKFRPVPEPKPKELRQSELWDSGNKIPNAEEWAKRLGINTALELITPIAAKSKKDDLQTLLYPASLVSRLQKIRALAGSAMDETGSNILYLTLGFLEWTDNDRKSAKHLAPLFTLPVKLGAGNPAGNGGERSYYISLRDDDAFSNVTLQEKLWHDFNLRLPSINKGQTPEDYFACIEQTLLKIKPTWQIKRRATLTLLNFTKQAMYQDLDPANWPKSAPLEEHPIIKKLFSNKSEESHADISIHYAEEHDIDRIPHIHDNFSLIYDADSSQHSALIDAVKGKNLVIEGPPGTGKSQTITNLIAACLNSGKTVLFVAEKMAALNVVKDRLDKAGLGEFCLELHSHKTNKKELLHALEQKLDKQGQYRHPAKIHTDIQYYENYKKQLLDYAERINQPWQDSGLSIHCILNRATRFRLALSLPPDAIALTPPDDMQLNAVTIEKLRDSGQILESVFKETTAQSPTGTISGHYWYGIGKTILNDYETRQLLDALQAWDTALAQLAQFHDEWQQAFNQDISSFSHDDLQALLVALRQLPALQGNEDFSVNPHQIMQEEAVFTGFLDRYEDNHRYIAALADIFKMDAAVKAEDWHAFTQTLAQLHNLCGDPASSPKTISACGKTAWDTQMMINQLDEKLAKIRCAVPENIRHLFAVHPDNQQALATFAGFIKQLPAELWQYRRDVFDNPDIDSFLDQLQPLLNEAQKLHKNLSGTFHMDDLPDMDTLQQYQDILDDHGLFRVLSPQWREARAEIAELIRRAKPDWQEITAALPDLVHYRRQLADIERLQRRFPAFAPLYHGVDTPVTQYRELRAWYKNIRRQYGARFDENSATGTTLFTLERNLAYDIADIYTDKLHETLTHVLQQIPTIRHTFKNVTIPTDANGNINLMPLIEDLKLHLPILQRHLARSDISLHELVQAVDKLQTALTLAQQLQTQKAQFTFLPPTWHFPPPPHHFNPAEVASARSTLALIAAVQAHPAVAGIILPAFTAEHYTRLQALAAQLARCLNTAAQSEQHFLRCGAVDKAAWLPSGESLAAIMQRNRTALAQPRWLDTWGQYLSIRNRLAAGALGNIIAQLESGALPPEQLLPAIELAIHHRLAQDIFASDPLIRDFAGMTHNAAIQRFRECDKKLQHLQREQIAYNAAQKSVPLGISSGRVSMLSEASLIRHESQKKTRHIAIRHLLDRASAAILALKPCFMMSPLSVAQYLKPGHFQFDVVIMDEASQILSEDAIGAIARSAHKNGSAVIVGDPKQLPPTRFFQKVVDGNDGDDGDDGDGGTVAVQEMESILDAVIPDATFQTRRLTWHYRSRHESLIAFSNHHFYDSKLILFPSPQATSAELGIRYKKIDGCFNEKHNKEEAAAIVEEAADILRQHPEESLGIVAMNNPQQEEIAARFEQMLKDDPLLQKIYGDKAKTTPVFIKNLENVQGDERDVILISMTYGPQQPGGRVYHRFGPINSNEGWRRLNVLFTRAKNRMHIFSSMNAADILTTADSKKGLRALRAFLDYCEKGHLHQHIITHKAPDSDFEIAVINALAQYGYQCEPQVGVNGFFIDIAVKNPHREGHFLLGIECDGATYHSAKSVRDRDRLRQEILENLGWEIHRIWSTDWFKNPEAVLWPILQRLETLSTQYARETGEDAAEIAATMQHIAVQEKPEHIDNATSTLPTTSIEVSLTTQHAVAADEAEQNEADWDESGHIDVDISDTSLATSSAPPLAVQLQQLAEELAHLHPDVPDNERLLRPEIIKLLLTEVPASREEFQNIIPRRMRENISVKEAPYLDRVLKIIETAP